MQNNIKISVIIPTHNRANTIIACVQSVLSQSYPVKEIIIIDDYSTDDTIQQLNKFRDDIILLKTGKRVGAQAARNIGIKAAKSNWIAFLDSDDEWLSVKIEKQASLIKQYKYNKWIVVHGNCFKQNPITLTKSLWELEIIDGENVHKDLLKKSGTLFPSIITSKAALQKINYLDEMTTSYHEWDTSIRLSKYCRFIHINDPLFIYNIHNDSISKNDDAKISGYQYIINKFKNDIINICGIDTYYNHLFINSVMALNKGQYKLCRKILEQVHGKKFKKAIIQLFSYLNIKPIYLNNLLLFRKWKR